ncbi:MAG TPA: hypothetical protein VN838_09550, partial [Bradyrhizobium sp.]|nr:hypothetical protein [Bradyrhizobium sp.]
REAVTDFLKGLRGGAVQISLSGLRVSCNHLRTGQQSISMAVNPWRAADFVRQMREVPGAVAVGWTSGRFDMERTLRFPAGGWREGANLRKQDISEKLSGVIAKTLSASAASSSWNDETGELRLAFRRPRPAMASLNLTETLDFVAIVAPEKPVAGDRLLLWLSNPTRITRDESIGAKLVLSKDGNRNDEESSSPIDDETVLTALAKEFRAQRWDSRKLSWK